MVKLRIEQCSLARKQKVSNHYEKQMVWKEFKCDW